MSSWRKLRKEEADLIAAIVRNTPKGKEIVQSLSERLVEDMPDGGMGSLRFKAGDDRERRFGRKIGEAEFTDEDGILVSAAVNLDSNDELFELDLWKVDFTSLKRYPDPKGIHLKAPS
jgi:hypothetical protein